MRVPPVNNFLYYPSKLRAITENIVLNGFFETREKQNE